MQIITKCSVNDKEELCNLSRTSGSNVNFYFEGCMKSRGETNEHLTGSYLKTRRNQIM